MKMYMIILDGAADRKIEILGNKTPLQVSNTPALDTLVKKGMQTLVTVIDENITPESDSGSMALLSYDPKIYYPGRGTLEGLGTGFIPEGYNYVAFRINFASYDEKLGTLDRRTARGLEDEELQTLAKDGVSHLKKYIWELLKVCAAGAPFMHHCSTSVKPIGSG